MASNYDDAIDQLRAAGLDVASIEFGRVRRCKVAGRTGKPGWYSLNELRTSNGDALIVGHFGVWQGNDNGAQKIETRGAPLTAEERAAVRRRMSDDRRKADAERRRRAERAAARATAAWRKCDVSGASEYLARKGVPPLGVRFSPSGALVIPVSDANGKIHGLQVIRGAHRGRKLDKEFWPEGVATKGHFHLIGSPTWIVLVAEGYATAASLHAATQFPVAVAFHAGNLAPVAEALRKRYPRARILICADDDSLQKCVGCGTRLDLATDPHTCPSCGAPHAAQNAGIAAASAAALAVDGGWVAPVFADPAGRVAKWLDHSVKTTDFNDLHAVEALRVVAAQVEARISELGWRAFSAAAPVSDHGGRGGLRPIDSLDELLERYALVYGHNGAAFDRCEHQLVALSDMRDCCVSRQLHRAWVEHPDRAVVRVRNVGFDPACRDPDITCNLWSGWPAEPKAGQCEKLLELLRFMCAGDSRPTELYEWVLKWIAYPIQNPGAKMKTALVVHGPQGAGKNLFFEALMAIYGPYGRVIDQTAVEDKFNDWASRKLFLIADEVVARSDVYHVKNKLKSFITGEWIRINPKNVSPYDERNHVNVVFLSNEAMPVVLDEDDRRHVVIWTPPKQSPGYYRAIHHEIANGGVAALHDYLLKIEFGDFNAGTLPPETNAKEELIDVSRDSSTRFFIDWLAGVIDLPYCTCLSDDAYAAYRVFCNRAGEKPRPQAKFNNALARRHGVAIARKRYTRIGGAHAGPHSVFLLDLADKPPATPEGAWVGEGVARFKVALGDLLDPRGAT